MMFAGRVVLVTAQLRPKLYQDGIGGGFMFSCLCMAGLFEYPRPELTANGA